MNITATNLSKPWVMPKDWPTKVTTRIDLVVSEFPDGKRSSWQFDRVLNSVEMQSIYADPSEENMRRMGGVPA